MQCSPLSPQASLSPLGPGPGPGQADECHQEPGGAPRIGVRSSRIAGFAISQSQRAEKSLVALQYLHEILPLPQVTLEPPRGCRTRSAACSVQCRSCPGLLKIAGLTGVWCVSVCDQVSNNCGQTWRGAEGALFTREPVGTCSS